MFFFSISVYLHSELELFLPNRPKKLGAHDGIAARYCCCRMLGRRRRRRRYRIEKT